jgi:hypothetical protein
MDIGAGKKNGRMSPGRCEGADYTLIAEGFKQAINHWYNLYIQDKSSPFRRDRGLTESRLPLT